VTALWVGPLIERSVSSGIRHSGASRGVVNGIRLYRFENQISCASLSASEIGQGSQHLKLLSTVTGSWVSNLRRHQRQRGSLQSQCDYFQMLRQRTTAIHCDTGRDNMTRDSQAESGGLGDRTDSLAFGMLAGNAAL